MKKILLVLLYCLMVNVYAKQVIKIGTGDPDLVFYRVGNDLCKKFMVDKSISCYALTSRGSIDNLQNLRKGKINLALAQSDMIWLGKKGQGPFTLAGPDPRLKVKYHLLNLQVVFLTRKNSPIHQFSDSKNYPINFGVNGSGLEGTIVYITESLGYHKKDFLKVSHFTAPQQAKALCDNETDLIAYIVPEKSKTIIKALQTCPMRFVNLSESEINKLIKLPVGYKKVIIKAGTYQQNNAIKTIGMELQGVNRKTD